MLTTLDGYMFENSKRVPVSNFFLNPSVGFVVGLDGARTKGIKTTLPLSVLEPTQDEVNINFVKKYAKNPPTELPLIIKYDNRFFVMDHTRTAAQIYRGDKNINVILVEFDDGKFKKP